MKPIGLQGYVILQVNENEDLCVIEDVYDEQPSTLGQAIGSYIDHYKPFPAYISIDIVPTKLGLNEYDPDDFKVGGTD